MMIAEDNIHESILLEHRENGVAWVTLNRPESVNSINNHMRKCLPEVLHGLDANPNVRVIVISGAGPKGFCAGADLKETRKPYSNAIEARIGVRLRVSWFDVFEQIRKPIIASVHGLCLGGGCEIALACDIRVASADAQFALPETGLGLIPGGGGTQRLARLIGMGPAMSIILSGDRLPAHEAYRIGLISQITQGDQTLQDLTSDLANKIAAKPPIACQYAKEAIRKGLNLDLQAGLELERQLFALLSNTDDHKEALAAFREKRTPHFRGQ